MLMDVGEVAGVVAMIVDAIQWEVIVKTLDVHQIMTVDVLVQGDNLGEDLSDLIQEDDIIYLNNFQSIKLRMQNRIKFIRRLYFY